MKYKTLFWGFFAFFAAAFVLLVFNNNVWYDEAYSLALIKHGFADIATLTGKDVHPPLYYFGLKCFTKLFGGGLFSAKIFSIVPVCLTMLFGFRKLSHIYNERTGFLFSVFFAAMPVFTIYSVQVRMYSWCVFFVFTCGVYAYLAAVEDKTKDWILFAVFAALSAYTHYFALVSAGIIYLFLFIASVKNKKALKAFAFGAAAFALYVPWLMSFIAQLADKVENEYWISPITFETIGTYFLSWFKCGAYTKAYIAGSAAVYVVAAAGLALNKKTKRLPVLLGIAVFLLTCAVGIAASLLVRPVFLDRYANHALVFFAVAAACGIASFDRKSISVITLIFYLVGFCVNYQADYALEYGETDSETGEYVTGGDFDALICLSSSPLYGVISYYSGDIPVYRERVSDGSPFENIYPLSEFDASSCQKAALFVSDGDEVPPEISEKFEFVEYDGDVVSYWQRSNVYVLSN